MIFIWRFFLWIRKKLISAFLISNRSSPFLFINIFRWFFSIHNSINIILKNSLILFIFNINIWLNISILRRMIYIVDRKRLSARYTQIVWRLAPSFNLYDLMSLFARAVLVNRFFVMLINHFFNFLLFNFLYLFGFFC